MQTNTPPNLWTVSLKFGRANPGEQTFIFRTSNPYLIFKLGNLRITISILISELVTLQTSGCSPCRGVTGIFFWGGKVIFPDFFPGVKCFFPVENSHFGRPKTNFRRFQKWKAKKKKKKRSSPLFLTFSCFHFQFSTFSPQFSPLFPFFLASFFPIRQQKFPGQKSLGGHSAPPPVTPLSPCSPIWNEQVCVWLYLVTLVDYIRRHGYNSLSIL